MAFLAFAVLLLSLICPAISFAAGNISVAGWQGAQNSGGQFSVSISGISEGSVRFITNNCTVSPSSGPCSGQYSVRVGNAGKYSIAAVIKDTEGKEYSISCDGTAGKADQDPIYIKGWGDTKDYYNHFDIQVLGGSTDGKITFETDGCSVSPASGTRTTIYRVTVTRVGAYSLKACMEGNSNYNPTYTVKQAGTAKKASQPPIVISGWNDSAAYGDSFTVSVSGGSTSEPLVIDATGCELTQLEGSSYEVSITQAGPYTLSASRAGNYGYYGVSAYACG